MLSEAGGVTRAKVFGELWMGIPAGSRHRSPSAVGEGERIFGCRSNAGGERADPQCQPVGEREGGQIGIADELG